MALCLEPSAASPAQSCLPAPPLIFAVTFLVAALCVPLPSLNEGMCAWIITCSALPSDGCLCVLWGHTGPEHRITAWIVSDV